MLQQSCRMNRPSGKYSLTAQRVYVSPIGKY